MEKPIDASLPGGQETEKVVKDNFNSVPLTNHNIFGDENSQTFFKDFKFRLNRKLFFEDPEDDKLSFQTIK